MTTTGAAYLSSWEEKHAPITFFPEEKVVPMKATEEEGYYK